MNFRHVCLPEDISYLYKYRNQLQRVPPYSPGPDTKAEVDLKSQSLSPCPYYLPVVGCNNTVETQHAIEIGRWYNGI